MRLRAGLAAVACVLVSTIASAQALTSIASVRVGYNTRKTTVQPQGELKTQIDALDRDIAEATRLGRTGELRRLYAKGFALLAGQPWTDVADYAASLVIRSEHVVVDSSKPYFVRLEQIYSPSIQLERAVKAHVVLRTRPAPPVPGAAAPAPPPPPQVVKDLGTFDGIGRDLRDTPSGFELGLQDVRDGTYQLAIELTDDTRALGTATLLVSLRKGLGDLVARLEAAAAAAPAALRDDILYPVDRMKQVNRGRLELRTFDPDRDFMTAEAVAASAKSGTNPFIGKTGDFKRAYLLDSASEILPYRLYVPTTYSPSRTFPLIVALHGLGGTEDAMFNGYNGEMARLAERHGYIVAAPLGYRVDGSYGWGLADPPPDPAVRRVQENSERDVMQVLQLVRQQYRIDETRIYLMGHSMGAIGTWKIAPKFPDIWAALGMFAGLGTPATLDRIKHVPEFVVHGDADATVNVQGSRSMVARARELGIDVSYIEVPGGTHGGVVAPNLPAHVRVLQRAHKGRAAERQIGRPFLGVCWECSRCQLGATVISRDGDRGTDDLSGEWPRGEKLDLEPAPPPNDWLQEFAAERPEAVPEPAIEPAHAPRCPAAVRAVPSGRRHFRLPLMLLAASIAFVALVEVPGLRHRRLLVVPPADLSAPPALVEAVRNDERPVPPAAQPARQQPRPELPPRTQPPPPQRREVSVPRLPPAAVPPAALFVRSAISLDDLLARTATSAAVPAPSAAPASPPPVAPAGGPSSDAAARRASRIGAVEAVVDRYRRAFNNRDARAVEAFWPGVDVRALERAFDRLVVQRFEFDRCRIELAGLRAFATCDGRARAVKKTFGDKNPPAQAREWTFTLGEAHDTWVILSVNSRPMQ